ncbi:MAG: adenylosuccinate lyase family protein [Halanaeroarchaeum sp.]
MSFHLAGPLYKNTFGTRTMREIFDNEAYVERFMQVEAALARAEAAHDVVPRDAAETISDRASLDYVDMDAVERNLGEQGLLSMSIIDAWEESLGEAGEYLHWGATSQDIMDTTTVLQVREGTKAVIEDTERVRDQLRDLAAEYRETPMMGRTHHVHAIPITFGLKVASWFDEVERDLDRLREARDRAIATQFFGAVGTLASLDEVGLDVQAQFAEELSLPVPDVSWQAARDRFAELVAEFSTLAGTLARIANQILLLNRPEIGEVTVEVDEGRVGSSTMPHKTNPTAAEVVVAMAPLLRGSAHVMQEVMESFDERSASTWYVEFAVLPEAFSYVHRAVTGTIDLLDHLDIHPDAMADNVAIEGDVIGSEPIMMVLAEEVGRQTAHDVVYENAMAAIKQGEDFIERLAADGRVDLSREALRTIGDPTQYTGVASRLVDRTIER